MNEAELLKRLMVAFKQEAAEHANSIIAGLIELEKNPGEPEKSNILEQIYRAAHSMKGASRAVNLTAIEKLFQALEGCFSKIRSHELSPSPEAFDVFNSVIKEAEIIVNKGGENIDEEKVQQYIELLNKIENNQELPAIKKDFKKNVSGNLDVDEPVEKEPVEKKTEPIDNSFTQKAESKKSDEKEVPVKTKSPEVETKEKTHSPKKDKIKEEMTGITGNDFVRLSSKKIDEIYLLAEESLQLKLGQSQEIKEIKEFIEGFDQLKDKWSHFSRNIQKSLLNADKKHSTPNTQQTINQNDANENLDSLSEQIKLLERKILQIKKTAQYVSVSMHNTLGNLVEEVKSILMLPISNLFDSFPRIVRDLAKDMKKEAEINITGANIEVDRRIMEELKAPLIHIIRNCIDHGIEKPEARVSTGKNKRGKIDINIFHTDANLIQIEISDDGAGISVEKVKKKALNNGIVTNEEVELMDDDEIINLIFKSGLSTSSIITDISGRGLGLAIVEENVEKLGGNILIKSEKNKGTTFSIKVPSTISKSQGLLIKINQKPFIFPVSGVVETLRILSEETRNVENKNTVQYRNKTLPLVPLSDVLELQAKSEKKDKHLNIVVVESYNQRIGFIVDELDDEQEILFKKPGYPIVKIRNIAGVSLLGTGEICPVLNNQDLVRTALQANLSSLSTAQKDSEKDEKVKSIIIAEDSITSRLFLKNILESAGYKVKTTVDGKEAFTALKQAKYDLLVSDVEMPRMNGFELTQAVRDNKSLSDLPVVLVTSLNKREDQEKGIEVGASAYIVKSSFEQSNLLEVINRLI